MQPQIIEILLDEGFKTNRNFYAFNFTDGVFTTFSKHKKYEFLGEAAHISVNVPYGVNVGRDEALKIADYYWENRHNVAHITLA